MIEDTSFLLKNKSIKNLWILRNHLSCHKNFDWEENGESEDNVKMIEDDKDILNFNIFTKLLEAAQNLSNFESHKISFLYDSHFFI